MLSEVYVEPSDPSGPLSPSRLTLGSLLDAGEISSLLPLNAAFLEACERGALLDVHEQLLELRADELLSPFVAGSLKASCVNGHLGVAEYLLRRGLLLETTGEEGRTMLDDMCFSVLKRALGAAQACGGRAAEVSEGEEGAGEGGVGGQLEEEEEEEEEEGGSFGTRAGLMAARRSSPSAPQQRLKTLPATPVARSTKSSAAGSTSSPSHDLAALALLIAARAEVDAHMGLLAGLLLPHPPYQAGTASAGGEGEGAGGGSGGSGGSGGASEPPPSPPILPASPSLALLWCMARLRCPSSPLQSQDGLTPLHVACAAGCLPECVALIAGGADVNAIARDGTTPLGAVRAALLQEEGEGGRGGDAGAQRIICLQACQVALLEEGGRLDWKEALSARSAGEAGAGAARRRHSPPGWAAVVEWGRRGIVRHEEAQQAEAAAKKEALAKRQRVLAEQQQQQQQKAEEGSSSTEVECGEAELLGGGSGGLSISSCIGGGGGGGGGDGGGDDYEEVYVGEGEDKRLSLSAGDGSLLEVNVEGGGGIYIEAGRKKNNSGRSPPGTDMPAGAIGVPFKRSASGAAAGDGGGESGKAGVSRASGSFGKFL